MSDDKKTSVWSKYTEKERAAVNELARGYIDFLSDCKTERESVTEAVRLAQSAGYRDLADIIARGEKLAAGDKVYAVNMKKAIVLFHIGTEPMECGMNILGAHIDTCRLDVKQNPLYEDNGLAYFDTHYYGGIKKYQWVTIPLALHGVVAKKDGTVVEIALGEKADDPVFCVTDLLVHLSQEQLEKKASKVIEGEKLDVLIGGYALKKDDKESVKDGILALLKEHYDIAEEDFNSAELTLVPAGRARELGFDRSMVLGYGQDDRVCSYTALCSMLETVVPKRTACCLLVDKEEIGSVGATGMQSRFFENMVAEVLSACGQYTEIALRRTLAHSKMLSSDVSSAYDGLYADAFEKKNVAYLGRGMVFNKFTGARGKSGSSDASAEYLGELRRMMDENGVSYQLAELGRVDLGGGGTIAYIMARYGMDVIDNGVAVMSMHAPWEVTSKVDIYEMKKGYDVFLRNA
ncbi:aminopeptidase [Selenomonas sp. oral taxon 920]|uniref:aminopeptidase n=1 Tax=Selenomonas sp. oral taxon 920 TaxID=1884263 RepID=UPI000840A768|nr:aminopeptidase [Selenomonas sp. oral taxon 920]AOH47694.1 aminopeptidase [Selenomonas sp. oral taxon 920]